MRVKGAQHAGNGTLVEGLLGGNGVGGLVVDGGEHLHQLGDLFGERGGGRGGVVIGTQCAGQEQQGQGEGAWREGAHIYLLKRVAFRSAWRSSASSIRRSISWA